MRRKATVICAGILVCLLVGCSKTESFPSTMVATTSTKALTTTEDNPNLLFEEAVVNGDYNKAIDIYNDSLYGNTKTEKAAITFMNSFIDERLTEYAAGKISENDFSTAFTTVERIDRNLKILDTMDDYKWKYQALNDSKDVHANGLKEFDEGNWLNAIKSFSLVVPADTENYENAQRKITEAQNLFEDDSLEEASSLAETDDYYGAIQTVKQAIYHLGETLELTKKLYSLTKSCETFALQNAEGFLLENNYSGAMEQIESAASIIGWTDNLSNYSTTISVTREENEIKEAYESKNYFAGLITWAFSGETSDTIERYGALCYDAFINEINSNADKAFGTEQDYDAAIRVLQEYIGKFSALGISIKGIDSHIDELIDYYLEYKPVFLTDLFQTQQGQYISVGNQEYDANNAKDINGVSYGFAHSFFPSAGGFSSGTAKEEDFSVTYNLNYQYSTLTGIVYRPFSSLSCKDTSKWNNGGLVRVYGDDVKLYESPRITLDTYDTIQVALDVSGVRNLKLVVSGLWAEEGGWIGYYNYYPKVVMANVQLYRHPLPETVMSHYNSSNQESSKRNLQKGDTLLFGKYEQDNNTNNGREDIEWILFTYNDKYVYLLSKKIIEVLPFHNKNSDINYENSDIRNWLNGNFIDSAFTKDEKSKLITMTAETPHNYDYPSTPQGNDVKDRVALMSIEELKEYFPTEKDLMANGTSYAMSQGLFQGETGFCPWWTRTMGKSSQDVTIVRSDGKYNYEGRSLTEDWVGIRPCICLEWESALELLVSD